MSATDTEYNEIAITSDWQLILLRDPDRRSVWTHADVDISWVYYDLEDGETEPPWAGIPQGSGVFHKDCKPAASAFWVKGSGAGLLNIYVSSPTKEVFA